MNDAESLKVTVLATPGLDREENRRIRIEDSANSAHTMLAVAALDPTWRAATEELRSVCAEAAQRCAAGLERNAAGSRAAALRSATTIEAVRTSAQGAKRGPESAGDAWLRAGLEALAEACAILGDTTIHTTEVRQAHAGLAIYIAHEADGEVRVLARGGAMPARVRTYTEGPRGFSRWLDGDSSSEQWLVGGARTPFALRRSNRNPDRHARTARRNDTAQGTGQ